MTVTNVNGAPRFDVQPEWQTFEDQEVVFRVFAFDPDNPIYQGLEVLEGGEVIDRSGFEPTVTYQAAGLPSGAEFDPDSATFRWTPSFFDAGDHSVTFIATDDGDGTGVPLSANMTVPINVLNANRRPEIAPIDPIVVNRDEVVNVPISVTDLDGDSISIAATSALPGFPLPDFMTLSDNGDGTAVLSVSPGAGDRGDYAISVRASDDGDGGGPDASLTEAFTFVVSVISENEPPRFQHIGNKVAVVGEPFELVVRANDMDVEPLDFSFNGLPDLAQVTVDSLSRTATIRWTATLADLGQFQVTATVADQGSGNVLNMETDVQNFAIVVRTSNSAPLMDPIGDKTVAESDTLQFSISASDAELDSLTYSSSALPVGATLDPVTGDFRWTPNLVQAGTYPVTFFVGDGNGLRSEQINIHVTNTNQPPELVPVRPQLGREDARIEFTVTGGDFDSGPLIYSVIDGLPNGALFVAAEGRFQWTPDYDQSGDYSVTFGVQDLQGELGTTEVLVRIADVNRPPSLNVSHRTAIAGSNLGFTLQGSDLDAGTNLSYSAEHLPEGASFDSASGEFGWTPGPGQVGEHFVKFTVSDSMATASRAVVIQVLAQSPGPDVRIELTPSFPAIPGQSVLIHPIASSFGAIEDLTLFVDGVSLALDGNGRARFTPQNPGKLSVVARAIDVDGFVSEVTETLKVRDANDRLAPVVQFDASINDATIDQPIDVLGSIEDSNLDDWKLEIASLHSGDFSTIATGDATFANSSIATLDPRAIRNGFYQLRLTAVDISGRQSRVTVDVEINSSDKSFAYLDEVNDLTTELGGLQVDLVRRYDSLSRSNASQIGFGWSFLGQRLELSTDVARTGREHLGITNPLRQTTRLFLTLPSGDRVGFSFNPQQVFEAGKPYYRPAWTADQDLGYQLNSTNATLVLAGDGFYDSRTGQPYNPSALPLDQQAFTLTATDGTRFLLNSLGDVVQKSMPSGEALFYSDNAIVSRSGDAIRFDYDDLGRLTRVLGPGDAQVAYAFDTQGNLAAVHQITAGTTTQYGYAPSDPHLLISESSSLLDGKIIDYSAGTPNSIVTDGHLGGVGAFSGTEITTPISGDAAVYYTFSLRESEIQTAPTDQVLLRVDVRSEEISNPAAIPTIGDLQPLSVESVGNRTIALFAVDRDGLQRLRVAADGTATTSDYHIGLSIAGDLNADGSVDGLDSQLLAGGDPVGDINGDGRTDSTDSQVLANNFGFIANAAPTFAPQQGDFLTHEDLSFTITLDGMASDPEGDETYYRIVSSSGGIAELTSDGTSIIFTPTTGFIGAASFALIASDGFSDSDNTTFNINVSDAPLLSLDFLDRLPRLSIGESQSVGLIANFVDQQNVLIPHDYVTVSTLHDSLATINSIGEIQGFEIGSTVLVASRGSIQAATAVTVGTPETSEGLDLFFDGLNVYPESVTIATTGGQRQSIVTLGDAIDFTDLTQATSGTQYFAGNTEVASVTPDGLIEGIASGATTVTVINGPAEFVLELAVQTPDVGPASIGTSGGIISGIGGYQAGISPGAFTEPTVVSVNGLDQADLSIPIPEIFEFAGAFELDLGDSKLSFPAQLAVPAENVDAGDEVVFFQLFELPNEDGDLQPTWLMVETGVVGDDGIARSTSPPYPGFSAGGQYLIAKASEPIAPMYVSVTPSIDVGWVYFQTALSSFAATIANGLAAIQLPIGNQVFTVFNRPYYSLPPVAQEISAVVGSAGNNVRVSAPEFP